MILKSDFFPLKRPPRSLRYFLNNVIIKYIVTSFLYVFLLTVFNHRQTSGFYLTHNISLNSNSSINSNESINNYNKKNSRELFQHWKYVYSNKKDVYDLNLTSDNTQTKYDNSTFVTSTLNNSTIFKSLSKVFKYSTNSSDDNVTSAKNKIVVESLNDTAQNTPEFDQKLNIKEGKNTEEISPVYNIKKDFLIHVKNALSLSERETVSTTEKINGPRKEEERTEEEIKYKQRNDTLCANCSGKESAIESSRPVNETEGNSAKGSRNGEIKRNFNMSHKINDYPASARNSPLYLRSESQAITSLNFQRIRETANKTSPMNNETATSNNTNKIISDLHLQLQNTSSNNNESTISLKSNNNYNPINQRNYSTIHPYEMFLSNMETTNILNDQHNNVSDYFKLSSEKVNKNKNDSKINILQNYHDSVISRMSLTKGLVEGNIRTSETSFGKILNDTFHQVKMKNISKYLNETEIVGFKTKKLDFFPNVLAKVRIDDLSMSDEADYGAHRTKAEKGMSTLLSPLDLTPLLTKFKHTGYQKPLESKGYLKQSASPKKEIQRKQKTDVYDKATASPINSEITSTNSQKKSEVITDSPLIKSDILDVSRATSLFSEKGKKSKSSNDFIFFQPISRTTPTEIYDTIHNVTRSMSFDKVSNLKQQIAVTTNFPPSEIVPEQSLGSNVTQEIYDVATYSGVANKSDGKISPTQSTVVDHLEIYSIEYANSSQAPLTVENLHFNDTGTPGKCTYQNKDGLRSNKRNCSTNDLPTFSTESNTNPINNDNISITNKLSRIKDIEKMTTTVIFQNSTKSTTNIENDDDNRPTQYPENVYYNTDEYFNTTQIPVINFQDNNILYNINTFNLSDDSIITEASELIKSSLLTTELSYFNESLKVSTESVSFTEAENTITVASNFNISNNFLITSNESKVYPTDKSNLIQVPSLLRIQDVSGEEHSTISVIKNRLSSKNIKQLNDIIDSEFPEISNVSVFNKSDSLSNNTVSKSNTNSTEAIWPVKLASVVEGDIILGGLMMVHSREDSVTCGPIMPQGGIQALEAMLYTLDRLNSDSRFMPNVTLGAHILDDCDKDTYGLEMAVDFIKVNKINVDCVRRGKSQVYDYSAFYQDDDSKLNEEFILGEEDFLLASKERNKNDFTTDGTFEEFQSFFIDRGKIRDREKYETSSTETPRRKSSRKHHKHRHRGKKTNVDLSQSLESFFNTVSFSQAPVDHLDKEHEFVYEDDELSKNEENIRDTTPNPFNLSNDEMEQKSLKEFEKFVKDVKENETQELLNEKYEDFNETEAYQYNIKHNQKTHHINDEDSLNDDSPYLLKMLSSDLIVDPSPRELMMISPGPFTYPEIPWPVKKEAVVEGDVNLGGLMMVHSREDDVTCGPIMPQGGIQALEAMLYTLDIFNKKLKLVPNVTIGAHILDDCDKDTYGLEMAVDFIKGSISNIDGAEYHCNKTQIKKVISGVVGAASSVTSIQVANLLRLFKIPQVSFFSTSPELSNKQRFEYFTRTIPSDHYQVKAMVDIIRELGWSYVSIIYEESNYGIKAFEELEGLLSKHNICIAVKEKLVKDSGVAEEIAYDSIVLKLQTKPRARGVIIFGSDQEVAGVMRAVRRSNATGAFSWIGSDGWSARSLVSDGSEPEVEGTLSVQPQANPVKGFEEYFLSLTVDNNERNPWFVEFWEDHFHCRYTNSSRTPYNTKYTVPCTGKEKLTRQNTDFEDQLQFVSDAVMAFAYAIRDMHGELCNGRPGLCDAMKPTKGPELLRYLRKVEFEGLSGDHFKFDSNGDGPARYNIIHFKQVSAGKHRWIKVGEYLEGELKLNMSEIQFKLSQPKPPESVCSLPCEQGQAKQYVEGESCCWHCFNCTQYQIRHPSDETQCVLCRRGTVPDAARVHCQDIPEIFLRPGSGWAIGAMALSSTGILVTLFVAGVFLRHNDTPVVRASGRELSYVLLAGILMCYCVTFALVVRPSDIVCGIQRFGAGFCFTVVYAALLTKTNRIARIFNAGKQSAKRPSLISPRSQLIICTGLISIQVVINGVWMIISPARAMHHYPTREDNLLVCDSYIDASYMIAFSYPIVLIVVCTVYAVLTRKIPEAFNESKHIGFTMYTTCVIWLAFVPLYFGTGNHVPLRITSMSVTISLSASVTVACLFSPKLYIILIRPERNVRQSMMPVRYSAFNKSSGTANSGAGSMMAAVVVTAATCNQKEKLGNKMQPPNDPDMELKKKVKLEERSTQTDGMLNNCTTKAKSVPSLTSLPTSVSNDILSISKNHRKNSSDLPSTQSVIVKLNNNGASILCSVKPTAVNKSALAVTSLASAVMPNDSPVKEEGSQNKNVTFDDEKNSSYGPRPNNIPLNTASNQCDTIANRSIANPPSVINNTTVNILIANSPVPGGVSNGPTVPSSLTESSVNDFAL